MLKIVIILNIITSLIQQMTWTRRQQELLDKKVKELDKLRERIKIMHLKI
jgi:hypothetical protein